MVAKRTCGCGLKIKLEAQALPQHQRHNLHHRTWATQNPQHADAILVPFPQGPQQQQLQQPAQPQQQQAPQAPPQAGHQQQQQQQGAPQLQPAFGPTLPPVAGPNGYTNTKIAQKHPLDHQAWIGRETTFITTCQANLAWQTNIKAATYDGVSLWRRLGFEEVVEMKDSIWIKQTLENGLRKVGRMVKYAYIYGTGHRLGEPFVSLWNAMGAATVMVRNKNWKVHLSPNSSITLAMFLGTSQKTKKPNFGRQLRHLCYVIRCILSHLTEMHEAAPLGVHYLMTRRLGNADAWELDTLQIMRFVLGAFDSFVPDLYRILDQAPVELRELDDLREFFD
ncbi:hypothetical protein HK097_005735 [Rhizophlyctis rosea]|uniref:Uncharacterized protein n=1 Tax=Rhizophlyctis rosea TaxID=64517 RepID=A0AAD5SFA5_9FUNG|nr:hypothetical protein HK097_005735 [Rhizophlyctis rosea]